MEPIDLKAPLEAPFCTVLGIIVEAKALKRPARSGKKDERLMWQPSMPTASNDARI
jgi:hypothetical protein